MKRAFKFSLGRILIFCGCLALVTACDYEPEVTKIPSNIREVRDVDGNLKSRVTVKDSVLHGPAEIYYQGGRVISTRAIYQNNKKHGLEKKFYKSGELYRERKYVEGKLQGIERRYFKNGSIRTIVDYKDSNPGVGLVEYEFDGQEISNWPELVMKTSTTTDGRIRLLFSFTDGSRVVSFYEGPLIEGKYFDRKEVPLSESNGIGEKLIYENEISEITISARRTTKSNAPHIASKTFYVK